MAKKTRPPPPPRKSWETRLLLSCDLHQLTRGGYEMAAALAELEHRAPGKSAAPREERVPRRW